MGPPVYTDLLLIIIVVLAVLLIGYVFWVFTVGKMNWFILGSLIVLICVAGWHEVRWTSGIAEAQQAVIHMNEQSNLQVKCQRYSATLLDPSPGNRMGYVYMYDPSVAHLKWRACESLVSWFDDKPQVASFDQIQAFQVLAHEAQHMKGVWDEAEAECYASQSLGEYALFVGAGEEEAVRWQEVYQTEIKPYLPTKYQHSC